MKKLTVFLAAVVLLCAALALSANAATIVRSGSCGDSVTYTLDSDGLLTISGTGDMNDYYDDAPWYSIRDSVRTVVINDGVASIGRYAFFGCTGLTSVTIPDSVTSIGDYAFYRCDGLTSVTIPDSVTSIGGFAFYGCTGLTSVTIPDSVTSIGYYAFYGCTGLTSVTIPDSVTFIVEGAFSGCTGLTSVTIPNSVTSIGDYAFYGCAGLTSVTIPDSVTTIGNSAFEGCTGLTSVTIPDSIVSIGHQVFRSCSGLVSVSLLCGDASFSAYYDEYTRSWLSNLFLGCPVSDLVVGDVLAGHTLQNLGFSKTSLQNVTILDGTTELMHRAFADYVNIKSIVIPDSVTKIGGVYYSDYEYGVFYNCTGLESVVIGNGVTTISTMSFCGCTGLKNITFGTDLTSIGSSAFSGCVGLTNVEIPSSVTFIGEDAFSGCTGLTSMVIPSGVTNLGHGAFSGCSGLESITVSEDNAKYFSVNNCVLRGNELLIGCKNSVIPSDGSIVSIGEYAFRGCTGLTEITIPAGVRFIDSLAFADCTGLTTVTIPKDVSCIEYRAFYNCPSLAFVNYTGTKTDWADIDAESGNSALWDAEINWHYGKPHTNGSPEATVTIPAGCLTAGEKHIVVRCTGCDCIMSERDESIPALGHSYVPHAAQAETCDEPGWEEYQTCSRCDYTTYQEIPPHEPQFEAMPRVPATCTSTGLTMGTRCALCGKVYTAQQEIPMIDHTLETHAAKQPTCTAPGWESYSACQFCDYSTKTEIPPLGHDLRDRAGQAATCSAVGWQAYQVCSRCGYSTYQELPKLPHTPVTDSAVAATCTATGLTAGSHCSVCGTVITAQQVTEMAPHTAETIPAVSATCTATGLTAGSKCSVCGKILTAQQITSIIPHTPETIPAVPATCAATGLTAGSKCSVCGAILTAQAVTEKLAHTPRVLPAVAATCTSTGLTEGSECSVCGAVLTPQQTVAEQPHTPVAIPGYPATCTAFGLTDGSFCGKCGAVITEQEDIPFAPHAYELTSTDPATETADGTEHYACAVCGAIRTEAFARASEITLSRTEYVYDGAVKTPSVSVKDADGNKLVKGRDYTVTYPAGRKLPGTYAVAVTLCGRYSGEAQRTFVINRQTLSAENVTLEETGLLYTGAAQHPEAIVKNAAGYVLTGGVSYTLSYSGSCTAPGTYTVTVTGTGYYAGAVEKTFSIAARPLTADDVTLSWTSHPYTGASQKPAVAVKSAAGSVLTQNSYTVSFAADSKLPGTYTVTVTGKGNYTGTVEKTYVIEKQPLNAASVTLEAASLPYNGSAQQPAVTVKNAQGSVISQALSYTVACSSESKYPGTYTLTVTGKGNYTGEVTKTFKIVRQTLTDANVTLSAEALAYNGSAQRPALTVTASQGTVLKLDGSYTAAWSADSKYPGTYTVTVTGKGYYTGTVEKTYAITKQALTEDSVALAWETAEYTAAVQQPEVTVTARQGTVLKKDGSYTVAYARESRLPGTYTLTVTGKGYYEGTVEKTYAIGKKVLTADNVTLSADSFTYNAAAQQPAVTVKNDAGSVLTQNSYTVSFAAESKLPGTYTVTVTGKGNYTGAVEKTYVIEKQPLTAANVALSAAGFTYNAAVQQPAVTVKNAAGSVLTQGASYLVTYSADSKFPGAYTVTVTGRGNYSGTVRKEYVIEKQVFTDADVTLSEESLPYNGGVRHPVVTVKNAAGSTLTQGASYTLTWSAGCKYPGTYTVTVTGKGNYEGHVEKTFVITRQTLTEANVTFTPESFSYNGKVQRPTVTVTASQGTVLTENGSYTVSFPSGCKAKGAYTVTITAKGYYTGKITKTFTIK